MKIVHKQNLSAEFFSSGFKILFGIKQTRKNKKLFSLLKEKNKRKETYQICKKSQIEP